MKRIELFDVAAAVLIALFAVACVFPIALLVSVSLTPEHDISVSGYKLVPSQWTAESYRVLFRDPTVGRSYLVSTAVTLLGTAIAVAITSMAAFALANKHVRYRNALAFLFFFTMVFRPGLVPWYMMCRLLGLRDNFWALLVPRLLFNPFNLFLVRNFMQGIPESLMESAGLDGANDFVIGTRIYFPLSKPVIATITLFYGIGYWDDWFNAIMLVNRPDIVPLQYLLMRLQSDIDMLSQMVEVGGVVDPPKESFKMATAIVTIGPIILLYPVLQRYFIRGLIVGSVKG